ncbi:type II CAAX prenyl endopeptidase Rce1 family protein [Halobacteriaceae archaeon GCM10025711]
MSRVHEWATERPVATFFVVTFAFTWLFNGIRYLLHLGPQSLLGYALGVTGAFGPPVAAAVVIALRGDDLRAWASRIVKWRVHPKWYVAAIGLPLAFAAGTTALYAGLGGPISLDGFPGAPVYIFVFGLVLAVFLGGGQEEGGWRGFALPHLQERYDALTASLIIGVFWALWHLPAFLDPAAPQYHFPLVNKLVYLPTLLGVSVILTWFYNNTGSIFVAMVFHGAENVLSGRIPYDVAILAPGGVINESLVLIVVVPLMVVIWTVAVVLLRLYGRRTLSRNPIPGPEAAGARRHVATVADD